MHSRCHIITRSSIITHITNLPHEYHLNQTGGNLHQSALVEETHIKVYHTNTEPVIRKRQDTSIR